MKWNFLPNDDGPIQGLNDSGIETFQGSPLKSLAREMCQNSLDAWNDESGKPVIIQFHLFMQNINEISESLDIESLNKAFTAAHDFWGEQKEEKTRKFFKTALTALENDTIPFLRISDFNTIGLLGSDKTLNTHWANLIRSSGVSDKSGVSGGSYGIGKFAPFACSHFRTLLYNTYDKTGVKAFQGVSRITSFKADDGSITRGIGYLGLDGNRPVSDCISIDPSFSRANKEYGTDVYIPAFRFNVDEWINDIIASVLDGFLGAINDGKLVVKVDDIEINSDTLESILVKFEASLKEHAQNYYKVLKSEETNWFEDEDFLGKGKVRLGLLIDPALHRKVAMIRKTGMKIKDQDRISRAVQFAGVFQIEGEEINDYLRALENPQHTKWEPKRADTPEEERAAEAFLYQINAYIRQKLKELIQQGADEEIDPMVGNFLPDENESESDTNSENMGTEIKDIEVRTVDPKRTSVADNEEDASSESYDEDGEESGGGNRDFGTQGGSSNGPGDFGSSGQAGAGDGSSTSNKKQTTVTVQHARVICKDKNNGKYTITFSPSKTAEEAEIDLFMVAESGRYPAAIVSAEIDGNSLNISNNKLTGISFIKDTKISLDIKIDFSDYCTMEVVAHGHTK